MYIYIYMYMKLERLRNLCNIAARPGCLGLDGQPGQLGWPGQPGLAPPLPAAKFVKCTKT